MKITLLVALALAFAGTADAAVKPKPWMWAPTKMETRLVATQPFVWQEVKLLGATCVGRGKVVAGRYTSFRCTIRFGSGNIVPYGATVFTRILPVGSGKLCVVATPAGKAVPHEAGTLGITVAEGRACP